MDEFSEDVAYHVLEKLDQFLDAAPVEVSALELALACVVLMVLELVPALAGV